MSQFTIYKSSDTSAPSFYGTTGSVVMLLDACLVNGYGTKPGAGWAKPFANTSSFTSSFGAAVGGWQQPTGSGLFLFVNDGGPNGTSLYREAWATGWEVLVSPSASVANTCGSGSGQFPLPSQLLTTGHTVIRKSSTSDSSSLRQWIVAADSSSFYMFISTGDTAGVYYGFGFGDFYSFKNVNSTGVDAYNCMIMGRSAENSSAAGNDGLDLFSALGTATTGNFIARSLSQISSSITFGKHGDGVKGSTSTFVGTVAFPNNADNALYISPVWVCENVSSTIRGQLRGLYQFLHPITNFVDQQTFTGALDYNGKTFTILKQGPNSGIYVIETSNTLATN